MKYKMTYDHENNFESIREKKKKLNTKVRKEFLRESQILEKKRKDRKKSRWADRDTYARFTS